MKIKQVLKGVGGELNLVVSEDGRVFELVAGDKGTNPAGVWREYELGKEIENDLKLK